MIEKFQDILEADAIFEVLQDIQHTAGQTFANACRVEDADMWVSETSTILKEVDKLIERRTEELNPLQAKKDKQALIQSHFNAILELASDYSGHSAQEFMDSLHL